MSSISIIATVPQVRAAITRAAESGALDVWLDLTDVTFMDSSGMHAMVDARRGADARQARFVIICPEGPVLRVVRIAGVDRGLAIFADRASAHAAT